MAVSLERGFEMRMLDSPMQKLQMGDIDSEPAKDLCGTPFSQASTAPSTPFNFLLPDPDYSFIRQISGQSLEEVPPEDQAPHTQMSPLQLNSGLGRWAQKVVEGETFTFAEADQTLCFQIPPLTSELGQWAQRKVEHPEPKQAIGMSMRSLTSELGKWAQKQVEAEEWLRRHMPREETFHVDSNELRETTSGLAYRKTKRVDDRVADAVGPMWGCTVDGIDQGDGWLRVGDFYLPMALEGISVLTPDRAGLATESDGGAEVEASCDGPALTADGRAVDLDGGSPLFFSCGPEHSSGQGCKAVLISAAKATARARLDQAAADAQAALEAGEACSIDGAGAVRGEAALAPAAAGAGTAERMKLLRRKRLRRGGATALDAAKPALCVDPSGKVFLFMEIADPAIRRCRREKRVEAYRNSAEIQSDTVMSIDANGIVRDRDEE